MNEKIIQLLIHFADQPLGVACIRDIPLALRDKAVIDYCLSNDPPLLASLCGPLPFQWVLTAVGRRVADESRLSPIASFNPKTKQLRIGNWIKTLTENEGCVVQALAEKKSLGLTDFIRVSGIDEPAQVVRRLRDKYPILNAYITLPGRKGRGGYSTTIVLE